jgi:zinc protease
MEPRWDEAEFKRLKQALETSLKGREANATAIGTLAFNKLLYGDDHRFGVPGSGTLASTKDITVEDLKTYYTNLSPKDANFHIAGAISKGEVEAALEPFKAWKGESISLPELNVNAADISGNLYFIDIPNAKQSVIYAGKLVLSANDDNANNLNFANEILGGGSSGRLFQTLRVSKGYTYGAYSGIQKNKEVSPFAVRTSVRANATLKSLQIIQDMLKDYGNSFTDTEVDLTRNKILKGNTRAYESLGAKLGILRDISKYNKPVNYLEQDQDELVSMSLDDYKKVIGDYLNEEEMIYVVVGDKATQFEEVKKLGKPVTELDIYGNKI